MGVRDPRPIAFFEQEPGPWSVEFGLAAMPAPIVRLGALDVPPLLEEDAMRPSGKLRVAINNAIVVVPEHGQWFDVEGGKLWMLDVVLDNAPGMRLHFVGVDLPADVELVVFSPDFPDEQAHRFGGRGPWMDGEFWSQTVRGSRARIECFVPAPDKEAGGKNEPAVIQFMVDEVSQLYRDIFAEDEGELPPMGQGGIAGAGACHNDTACFFPDWQNISDAVARITFIEGGSGFSCSGNLITTVANDLTPYFVTAFHCIDTNLVANTAEVRWKYRRISCGGSISNGSTSLFCSLMHAYCRSDHSLLMVEGGLPAGLFWAGYSTTAPTSGTHLTSVHHPGGTQQRISFALKGNTPQLCAGACANGATNYALMTWSLTAAPPGATQAGVTEGGSSGGGVFRNSNQQLVGIVSCGGSSCASPTSPDTYGRFDRAHSATTVNGQPGGNWGNLFLQAGSDDSLEPNNSCAEAPTLRAGTYSNLVVKSTSEDWYHVVIPTSSGLNFNLQFTHSWGNINAQLYSACDGTVVASGLTLTNNEIFSFTNSTLNTEFYLRVFLASDTRNTYNLIVTPLTPINNVCSSAPVIGVGTHPFSTLGATTNGLIEPACNLNGITQIDQDIWYRYFSPCTGEATFSVCDADFDTKIAVYSFACPTVPGTTLACEDNVCGDGPTVTIPVQTNGVYRVRLGGVNGASGIGTLVITCGDPPPPPPVCDGDINEDGMVNVDDLLLLLGSWGSCVGCLEDLNNTGIVDVDDLLLLLGGWGPCPE